MIEKKIIVIIGMFFLAGTLNLVFSQEKYTNNLLIIKAYNANKQPEKAIKYYRSISNKSLDIKTEIGQSYLLLEDFKAAANYFLEVNKENPKIDNYELAQCYSQMNKPAFAAKYLEVYLNKKDKQSISRIKNNKNFEKISSSDEWIELWKKDWYSASELLYNDADYEYRNKNYNESIKIIEKVLKKRPMYHQALFLMTQDYIKLNKKSHALYAINEAIKINSNHANYFYIKSSILKELKKPKKAQKAITNAFKLDSSNIDFYILQAELYLKLKKIDNAEKEIEQVLNYVKSANTHLVAANIYTLSGNYLLALKNFNLSLHKEPNNTEIFILRGDVYALTKTYEFAEKDYSMALDYYPTNGEIYYKRGLVRANQKKYKEACSDFNKAYNYKYMKAEEAIKNYCQ